ncbi:SPOR domain-containing protein [Citromicrobium bathyomarinum]|uniref:SPOR domain-containing protein n=1 Tax=Citromicrobium bathyomarinum TaxID=72174 RepID=UPI0031599D09
MIRQNIYRSMLMATALAALPLTGCASIAGGSRTASVSDATEARTSGKTEKAVALAEQAALAAPQDPAAKAELGNSYLAAGRFASARQAFDDALALGDVSPRTALGFILASIGVGDNRAAIETLDQWRDAMSPADAGLAYALAGNPAMGAQILTNALRSGDNTATVRQNLAYTHALGGQWATARILAAEDVPPAELDERISQWASVARPEDYTARVAALIGVQPQADAGMPAQLALGANSTEALMAEAAAKAPAVATSSGELPPVDLLAANTASRELKPLDQPFGARSIAASAPANFDSAFGATGKTPRTQPAGAPMAQPAPAKSAPVAKAAVAVSTPKPATQPGRETRSASSELAGGSHLVQLGSYGSEADAKRGWAIFSKRYPQISDREQVITRAKVNGKIYYRLSAGNLAEVSARSVCEAVKAKGYGCIAWEESKPLPGTLDARSRVASR